MPIMETLVEHHTFADFAALPEGTRVQLIDGELIMSPAPSVFHQRTVGRFFRRLAQFADRNEAGEAFISPIDVKLDNEQAFQPDVVFVSAERLPIVKDSHIEGAPDLVAEVLSPSTGYYDLAAKRLVYEAAGVREYWLLDPKLRQIEVLTRQPSGFKRHALAREAGEAASALLPGFSVTVAQLFGS